MGAPPPNPLPTHPPDTPPATQTHLEVLATHEASVHIDGAQRDGAALFEIKVQVLCFGRGSRWVREGGQVMVCKQGVICIRPGPLSRGHAWSGSKEEGSSDPDTFPACPCSRQRSVAAATIHSPCRAPVC